MAKIVLVGAGSVAFAQSLIRDILVDPGLSTGEISLMDINAERLSKTEIVGRLTAEKLGISPKWQITTDLKEALSGADYVITMFRCGTLEHQRLEYEIPMKYHVDQVVSDTLGPGGVFRGLRTLKCLFEVLDAMEEICPGAMLLNYVNPMSINTIALSRRSKTVPVIGLCHSVPHIAKIFSNYLNIPENKIHYTCAGVNHQAFVLKLEADGRDLYPELWRVMENPEIYRQDRVRFEIMRYFGYFPTESSGHGSEYVPYFRKRPDLIAEFCRDDGNSDDPTGFDRVAHGVSGSSLPCCEKLQAINERKIAEMMSGKLEVSTTPSVEYAVKIIAARENNTVFGCNLNVMNNGLIPSLPPGCSVEVPCLVDGVGVHPCRVEHYPEELAGLNRNMINVQMLAAEGALDCDRNKIFLAIAHDPVSSAVCSLAEIKAMTEEMFAALGDQIDPRFSVI